MTTTKTKPRPKTKTPKRRPRPRGETAAQKNKRLGPSRKIVRWEANPRKHVRTQIAILECGHARALPRGPRATYRCNQCRIEARDGSPVLSRYQKALVASGKPPVIVKTPVARRVERKAALGGMIVIEKGVPRRATATDEQTIRDLIAKKAKEIDAKPVVRTPVLLDEPERVAITD